jgi:hypothetical protein
MSGGTDAVVRAACPCGAVRCRVEGSLRAVAACHCRQGRKTSDHYIAATSALRKHVTMEAQEGPRWFLSPPVARRGFCGICGRSLFWERPDGPRLSLQARALEGATGLTLAGHIFCADKGDCYEITDDPPRAAGQDPSLTVQ